MQQQQTEYPLHPAWWNEQYNTPWERIREAVKRDWDQTRYDFGGERGRDLNQTAGDTMKQALGKEPLPLTNQRTQHPFEDDWDRVEHALRYGYGAGRHYTDHLEWDDQLESRLREEWPSLKSERSWDDAKPSVRRGWAAARDIW